MHLMANALPTRAVVALLYSRVIFHIYILYVISYIYYYHRQVIKELVWSEITTGPDPTGPHFGRTVEILFKLN